MGVGVVPPPGRPFAQYPKVAGDPTLTVAFQAAPLTSTWSPAATDTPLHKELIEPGATATGTVQDSAVVEVVDTRTSAQYPVPQSEVTV